MLQRNERKAFGRDHEETLRSIGLLALICWESSDSDQKFYLGMLPRPSNYDVMEPLVSNPRYLYTTIVYVDNKMRRPYSAGDGNGAVALGLDYMKSAFALDRSIVRRLFYLHGSVYENSDVSDEGDRADDLICWNCISSNIASGTSPLAKSRKKCQPHCQGISPLHYFAVARKRNPRGECVDEVRYLLNHGADAHSMVRGKKPDQIKPGFLAYVAGAVGSYAMNVGELAERAENRSVAQLISREARLRKR